MEDVTTNNSENKNETKEAFDAILRVRSKTPTKYLAGAIVATMKAHGYAELRAIGDGAIGKASKAAAMARSTLTLAGVDMIHYGFFFITEIDGSERTGYALVCEPR